MADADETDQDDVDLVMDVMVGEPGEKPWNTLVLCEADVVIPLERDLDADPFQDDEVWLCGVGGTIVQRRYSTDEEVEEDQEKRILFYRFTQVRYGVYSVWTKIGGEPAEILRGLIVNRQGIFVGDTPLSETHDGVAIADETRPEAVAMDVPVDELGGEDDSDEEDGDGEDWVDQADDDEDWVDQGDDGEGEQGKDEEGAPDDEEDAEGDDEVET